MYSKVQFFTKLLNMGMLYVFSMIFGAKNLISELKLTLRFMYCIVLYNFVPIIYIYVFTHFLYPKNHGKDM